MSTVPSTSGAESSIRIRQASPLTLAAMGLGLSAAKAIELAAARAAEAARLAAFEVSL